MRAGRIPYLPRGRRSLSGFLLAVCFLLGLHAAALGQNPNSITLTKPDLSQFPQVTVFFWPYNASGEVIQDVQASDVKVLENSRQVDIGSLERIEPGIHFVVAVNEGPTLANRYAGVQRFESIKQALTDWVGAQPSPSKDDFSLVNNGGAVQTNLSTPADWLNALQQYQPDLKAAAPGMSSLTTGIDTAGSVGDSPYKTKALLYITPLPEDTQLTGIQDAAARASQLGVHLFVWLIGPQNYSTTEGAMVLQKAAADTGGSFFLFSGAETLPQIAGYLAPLKYVYRLTYLTSIRSTGNFDLTLEVQTAGLTLSSSKMPFSLQVEPPNPIFLTPPSTIRRSWVSGGEKGQASLTPDSTTLRVMFEYPDGHPRSLASSRLFVDGKMVAENTAPPFDLFTWDLSGYTVSGTHQLQVAIEDQLGMTSQTIEIPVSIQVEARPRNGAQKVLDWFTPIRGILVGACLAAIAALASIVIRRQAGARRQKRKKKLDQYDPLTQTVEVKQERIASSTASADTGEWPRGQGSSPAPARLRLCSTTSLDPLPGEGFAVYKKETWIGSNAARVDIVLSGASISEVHACIYHEEGIFRLQDAGSVTGTWLNYSPVPARSTGLAAEPVGVPIESGDLIQIGRVPLLFEIYQAEPPQIQVLPYQELE